MSKRPRGATLNVKLDNRQHLLSRDVTFKTFKSEDCLHNLQDGLFRIVRTEKAKYNSGCCTKDVDCWTLCHEKHKVEEIKKWEKKMEYDKCVHMNKNRFHTEEFRKWIGEERPHNLRSYKMEERKDKGECSRCVEVR